jgi:hypothetical protein
MAGTSETELVSRRPSPGCSGELIFNSAYESNAVTRGSEGRIRSLEQCVESGGRARPFEPDGGQVDFGRGDRSGAGGGCAGYVAVMGQDTINVDSVVR